MNKAEFVQGLRAFSLRAKQHRGDEALAQFLANYIEDLDIPAAGRYPDIWRIEHYLPQILGDAWEEFRTGPDHSGFRAQYVQDCEHEVVDLVHLELSHPALRVIAVGNLGHMAADITGSLWVKDEVTSYFNAEAQLLQLQFDRFARQVLRRGLFQLIDQSTYSGMSGRFGNTELRTFCSAARLMMTFVSADDENVSVSFVGDDGDPLGLAAGMQSVYCPLQQALALIEDVITNWPDDPIVQATMFVDNSNISLI